MVAMIYKVSHYWVANDSTPTIDDVKEAIEAAKRENCTVCLHWKGPGYRWYGDTYSIDITADSDLNEVCNSLPKTYGI